MQSVSDKPEDNVIDEDAQDLWMKPRHERKACLRNLCLKVYNRYISLSYNSGSKDYVQTDSDCTSSYSIQLLRLGAFWGIVHGICGRYQGGWRRTGVSMLALLSPDFSCVTFYQLLLRSPSLPPSTFVCSITTTVQSVNLGSLCQCPWYSWKKHSTRPSYGTFESYSEGCNSKFEVKQDSAFHLKGWTSNWNTSSTNG